MTKLQNLLIMVMVFMGGIFTILAPATQAGTGSTSSGQTNGFAAWLYGADVRAGTVMVTNNITTVPTGDFTYSYTHVAHSWGTHYDSMSFEKPSKATWDSANYRYPYYAYQNNWNTPTAGTSISSNGQVITTSDADGCTSVSKWSFATCGKTNGRYWAGVWVYAEAKVGNASDAWVGTTTTASDPIVFTNTENEEDWGIGGRAALGGSLSCNSNEDTCYLDLTYTLTVDNVSNTLFSVVVDAANESVYFGASEDVLLWQNGVSVTTTELVSQLMTTMTNSSWNLSTEFGEYLTDGFFFDYTVPISDDVDEAILDWSITTNAAEAIPEPASIVLLGMGILAIGAKRRKSSC